MLARRALIDISYQGVRITDNINDDLLGFSYTDNASGAADDISITLKDVQKKWLTSWTPLIGDEITTALETQDWRSEGDKQRLECGLFIVDEPTFSGPPSILTINAISMPSDTDFTETEKSRTWAKASIKEIAKNIAGNAGLQLGFDSNINPTLTFIEQSETSDMSFLNDLCSKLGLAMKTYNKKIVIFDEATYEAKKPVTTLDITDMTHYEIKSTKTRTSYDSCKIKYYDPISSEDLDYTFTVPGKKAKKTLKVNEDVLGKETAERMAKGYLRKANKGQVALTCTIAGNLEIVATNTVNITGFGIFDGKYYVDKITHSLKSFQSNLELHRVLEGY